MIVIREKLYPRTRYFIPLFILSVILLLTVLAAGCILQDTPPTENESKPVDPLLPNFSDYGSLYMQNITGVMSYVVSEGEMLGVNLTEEEMMICAVKIAAKYLESQNETDTTSRPEVHRYKFDWGEFHLTIARAYNLTDEEIFRYIPASSGKRIYGHHGQPVPEDYYDDILDPEHKRQPD